MEILNSYSILIILSLVVILSYLFTLISKKTNVPSVLMLIITGILIKQGMKFFEIQQYNLFPLLEILGIVGLIMIVLEAALDLELKKEKWSLIWKSFGVALLGLAGSVITAAMVINFFIEGTDNVTALIYAIPLSIMSSAVVIPSMVNLTEHKKEFMIYESTFSDILGIMVFYTTLQIAGAEPGSNLFVSISGNVLLTILISVIGSYLLIFLFQNINTPLKLFLLISILLLLYSVGKMLHLSSLLIILVFGLIINNNHLFFGRGLLKKWIKKDTVNVILKDFKLVTLETAFIVRTFFFVIFGITISLATLFDFKVIFISTLILLLLYGVRFLTLRLFVGTSLNPQLYIAPRGLITILLFFSIPEEFLVGNFNSGILLFVILVTSIVMTVALIRYQDKDLYDDMLFDKEVASGGPSEEEESGDSNDNPEDHQVKL